MPRSRRSRRAGRSSTAAASDTPASSPRRTAPSSAGPRYPRLRLETVTQESSSTRSTSPSTHAGAGSARALLEALIASAAEHGIWTIQTSVFPENAASLALHERLGFRIVGRRERIAVAPRQVARYAAARAEALGGFGETVPVEGFRQSLNDRRSTAAPIARSAAHARRRRSRRARSARRAPPRSARWETLARGCPRRGAGTRKPRRARRP